MIALCFLNVDCLLILNKQYLEQVINKSNKMVNENDCESYLDSILDDSYNPLEYKIHESGKEKVCKVILLFAHQLSQCYIIH